MAKREKRILLFLILMALCAYFSDILEARSIEQWLFLGIFTILFTCNEIIVGINLVRDKQNILMDLLWRMSLKVGLEDKDIEDIQESLKELRKFEK